MSTNLSVFTSTRVDLNRDGRSDFVVTDIFVQDVPNAKRIVD